MLFLKRRLSDNDSADMGETTLLLQEEMHAKLVELQSLFDQREIQEALLQIKQREDKKYLWRDHFLLGLNAMSKGPKLPPYIVFLVLARFTLNRSLIL